VSRLRAKLEQMRELERQAVDDAEAAAHGRRLIGRRSGEDDRERLRGIPMIGGAAGAIPGTPSHVDGVRNVGRRRRDP